MPGLMYPIQHVPMLGKGSVLFDRFDADGQPTGYLHLGNCHKLELTLKDEHAELYSSINKNVSLLATALKKRTVTVQITGTDFRADVIALAMMSAGKTSLPTSASAFVEEVLASATATKKGKYFETVNKNIDPSGTAPVVTSHATVPAVLVAGVDYILADAVEGLIYFPVSSSVDDTKQVTITYSTLVGSFDQVAGAAIPQSQGRLRFSPDPSDGQRIGIELWRCNLYPSGNLGLISDDYGNWTLDANVLDDSANHPACPYFLETFYK